MIIILIDEVGTWPADLIIHKTRGLGVTTFIEESNPGNRSEIKGIELNAAGQTEAIHFDMEIEQYHPELLDDLYLRPEEPFCHQCKRRHNQNFCVRNGRSKRFQMNKARYK